MPSFTYIARDQDGSVQTGHLDAVTEDEIVSILQHRGLLVTSIARKHAAQGEAKPLVRRVMARRMHVRVTTEDQVLLCQQLATLVGAGVPLLSSLEILGNSSTNKVYGQAINSIKDYVKEGKTMAQPMEETGLFPPMTVQMVQVGEEVGELSKMTGRMAAYYEERVSTFIARMTRLFEPIAIVFMGIVVLFIVLSIFMPLFQLSSGGGLAHH